MAWPCAPSPRAHAPSIGHVQETFLFSDTLKGNIAFGVEKSEQAEIEWAAEIAGLTEDMKVSRWL